MPPVQKKLSPTEPQWDFAVQAFLDQSDNDARKVGVHTAVGFPVAMLTAEDAAALGRALTAAAIKAKGKTKLPKLPPLKKPIL